MTRTTDTTVPALRGAFTALVTPFTAAGDVDEAAFRALAEWQVLAGIDGLVPVGTTGEAPTLSSAERDRLIEIAVAAAALSTSPTRPLVVAGTGTNDTRASIEATRRAAALGADAALVVAPYYNRPDQRMLDAHFRAIADEGGLPIVVYNVPSRTGTNVEADTFLRLAEHPRVVAVKEASGNIEQIAVICRDRPRDVAVLAGDDAATLAVLAMGGDGVVSVAGNEIPGEMAALCAAARAGDWVDGAPDPRSLAAAVPGELPGRAEPGAGEGRPRGDGPARARRPARAAAAAGRRTARAAGRPAANPRPRGRRRAAGRPAPDARRAPRDDDGRRRGGRGGGMTALDTREVDLSASILDDLDSGRRRAATPDPDAPGGWRADPEVKAAILARFRDRATATWDLGGALAFRDRVGLPVKRPARWSRGDRGARRGPTVADRPGRDQRPGRRLSRPGRRDPAPVVRERRRVDRRRHDGGLARPGRLVRPDRGAGPPVGRRDDRRRPRAGRRQARHRRGRGVRRGGQLAARRRRWWARARSSARAWSSRGRRASTTSSAAGS